MKLRKYVFFIVAGVFLLGLEAQACHLEYNSDLIGSAGGLIGHKQESSIGTTVTFEQTSASVSTTSDCDTYVSFWRMKKNRLAEEAAQGQGEHLAVLARYQGCPVENYPEFIAAMHARYDVLFTDLTLSSSREFFQQLDRIVQSDSTLRDTCRN